MLVSVNIPMSNDIKFAQFYGYLLGASLKDHPHTPGAYYVQVPECALTMFPRHHRKQTTTCYFEVEDIDKAIERLVELGGRQVGTKHLITAGSIKRWSAIVEDPDPDGNHVGLISKA